MQIPGQCIQRGEMHHIFNQLAASSTIVDDALKKNRSIGNLFLIKGCRDSPIPNKILPVIAIMIFWMHKNRLISLLLCILYHIY